MRASFILRSVSSHHRTLELKVTPATRATAKPTLSRGRASFPTSVHLTLIPLSVSNSRRPSPLPKSKNRQAAVPSVPRPAPHTLAQPRPKPRRRAAGSPGGGLSCRPTPGSSVRSHSFCACEHGGARCHGPGQSSAAGGRWTAASGRRPGATAAAT